MEQIKEYEYVDLSLPSGLRWATMNIGAETETDYGDYFMWGSTTPNTVSECTWTKAPFNNGSSNYNETYLSSVKDTVCPNGILTKECDAASKIMGSEWRMPTQTECQELIDNTNSKWVEDYNGSGVNGMKFTGSNDNSIFIPAAAYYGDGFAYDVGNYGDVWSSSLYTSDPYNAWFFGFNSGNCAMDNDGYGRCDGYSVRGVL